MIIWIIIYSLVGLFVQATIILINRKVNDTSVNRQLNLREFLIVVIGFTVWPLFILYMFIDGWRMSR